MPKIEPEMSHQTWCSRRWQCKKVFSGHGHPLPWPRQKTNGACEKTGDTCFRCVSSQILCLKKAENDLHPRLPALKSGLWILYDMTFFDWETESIAIESFRLTGYGSYQRKDISHSCTMPCPGGTFRVFPRGDSDMVFCRGELRYFMVFKMNVNQHS